MKVSFSKGISSVKQTILNGRLHAQQQMDNRKPTQCHLWRTLVSSQWPVKVFYFSLFYFLFYFIYIFISFLQVLVDKYRLSPQCFYGIPECVNKWASVSLFLASFLGLLSFYLLGFFFSYLDVLVYILSCFMLFLSLRSPIFLMRDRKI